MSGKTDPTASTPFLVQQISSDPVTDSYCILETYGLYFWLPYLGLRTYMTWALIKSFAWGSKTSAYPSISRLARILSNSPDSRKTLQGRPGSPGTLARLQKEKLLRITTDGKAGLQQHTFHILRALPLLTPDQLATLTPSLRRDHSAFLRRFKIAYEDYISSFDHDAESQMGGSPVPRGCVLETQGVCPGDPGGVSPAPTNQTIEASLTQEENELAYAQLFSYLETNYTREQFSNLFSSCRFHSYVDGTLLISVTNALKMDWLVNRLHATVYRTAVLYFPDCIELRFLLTQPTLL